MVPELGFPGLGFPGLRSWITGQNNLSCHLSRIGNEKRPLWNVDEGQGAGRRGGFGVHSDWERMRDQMTPVWWPLAGSCAMFANA